jgi:hypothetical protein
MTKILLRLAFSGPAIILAIKTHLTLNWLIRLGPKFTNFRLLTSSAVLQKIEHVTLLLVQKFPKDWPVLKKTARTV